MATNLYNSLQWARVRLEILERDGYRCRVCGPKCKGKATEVDHIIPTADGGPMFDPSNLRASCDWCNTWRAQRQKNKYGWKRSRTKIILVIGPIAAGKSTYVSENAGPRDLVVDYDAISKALGPELPRGHNGVRHEMVREVRNRLIKQIQRGDVAAERAWIISCNPDAEAIFPHHEVRVVDPGRDEVIRRCVKERPAELLWTVDEWYEKRSTPEAIREW